MLKSAGHSQQMQGSVCNENVVVNGAMLVVPIDVLCVCGWNKFFYATLPNLSAQMALRRFLGLVE